MMNNSMRMPWHYKRLLNLGLFEIRLCKSIIFLYQECKVILIFNDIYSQNHAKILFYMMKRLKNLENSFNYHMMKHFQFNAKKFNDENKFPSIQYF